MGGQSILEQAPKSSSHFLRIAQHPIHQLIPASIQLGRRTSRTGLHAVLGVGLLAASNMISGLHAAGRGGLLWFSWYSLAVEWSVLDHFEHGYCEQYV